MLLTRTLDDHAGKEPSTSVQYEANQSDMNSPQQLQQHHLQPQLHLPPHSEVTMPALNPSTRTVMQSQGKHPTLSREQQQSLLQIVAQMFRQQADLSLKHANQLENIAHQLHSNPDSDDPSNCILNNCDPNRDPNESSCAVDIDKIAAMHILKDNIHTI